MPAHNFPPLYNEKSQILILGSFPSVKSREQRFFYGHKQNRFWKVMAALFDRPVPETIDQKIALLLNHHVAVWDVIASCEIHGSSDATITEVEVNNLSPIFEKAAICQVYANGKKAYELYQKYTYPKTGREAIALPSTSPANAQYSLERLIEAWRIIKENLDLCDTFDYII